MRENVCKTESALIHTVTEGEEKMQRIKLKQSLRALKKMRRRRAAALFMRAVRGKAWKQDDVMRMLKECIREREQCLSRIEENERLLAQIEGSRV